MPTRAASVGDRELVEALRKPFLLADLAAKLHAALGAPA
jgi:hypothetical protein